MICPALAMMYCKDPTTSLLYNRTRFQVSCALASTFIVFDLPLSPLRLSSIARTYLLFGVFQLHLYENVHLDSFCLLMPYMLPDISSDVLWDMNTRTRQPHKTLLLVQTSPSFRYRRLPLASFYY